MHEDNWLQNAVLEMGRKTLAAVDNSIIAMLMNDTTIAVKVRETEKQVDSMYHSINEYCLDLLANNFYPRTKINFLVNSLKIAMELERICDYANQIAKIEQKKLSKQNTEVIASLKISVAKMQEQSVDMVRLSLVCYEKLDSELVNTILDMDDEVDKRNRELFRDMLCLSSINPWSQEVVMDYQTAVRYIERVGDRATNIAELVYYIIHGQSLK